MFPDELQNHIRPGTILQEQYNTVFCCCCFFLHFKTYLACWSILIVWWHICDVACKKLITSKYVYIHYTEALRGHALLLLLFFFFFLWSQYNLLVIFHDFLPFCQDGHKPHLSLLSWLAVKLTTYYYSVYYNKVSFSSVRHPILTGLSLTDMEQLLYCTKKWLLWPPQQDTTRSWRITTLGWIHKNILLRSGENNLCGGHKITIRRNRNK